jgi:hypothetical protein
MKYQNEWVLKKKAEGCASVRPILTKEATQALDRLTATRTKTQAICQAIIELDAKELNNAKHH